MSIEGEIAVTLHWDGSRVGRVRVRSTRPAHTARVAVGRGAAEAARLLPTLYAVCGHAQRAAATAALRAAGADLDVPAQTAASVRLEAVQETFWRLLIDLPRALGLGTETAAVATARAVVARAIDATRSPGDSARAEVGDATLALAALAREHVYASDPAAWLAATDLMAFDRWCASAGTLPARAVAMLAQLAPGLGRSETPPMPDLESSGWPSVVAALQHDAAFAGAPTWDGVAVETGALARQREHRLVAALVARDGNGASTRIAARLVELARWLDALASGADVSTAAVQAWPLGQQTGLAAVQTARGLLLHLAGVERGRVADYRIVAPTDWNFHPDGALVRGLAGLDADREETLRERAGVAVLALDPCVAFRIEVLRHA